MTQDDDNGIGRRTFIKTALGLGGSGLTGGCLGGGGGFGGILGNGQSRTIKIPGYQDKQQFETAEKILKQKKGTLNEVRGSHDSLRSQSGFNQILSDDGSISDVRVALDGSTSRNPENTGLSLNGLVKDPEYVLSTSQGDSVETKVKGDGGLVDQKFDAFDIGALDVSGTAADIEDTYGLLDQDSQAIKSAVREAGQLQVYAATDLDLEQPAANPEALKNLSNSIEAILEGSEDQVGLQDLYHEAKDAGSEIDQYTNDLANGIRDARQDADGNDNIKFIDQKTDTYNAKEFRKELGAASSRASQTTEDIAGDIARLATTKKIVDKAYNRAVNIEETAADSPVDSQGGGPNTYEDLESLNSATDDRDLTRGQVERFAESQGYGDADFDFQYDGGAVDVLTDNGEHVGTITGDF
jgi:hypothetical protein